MVQLESFGVDAMTINKAIEIIQNENLQNFNLLEERNNKENEVVILKKDDKWMVYVTDERASKIYDSVDEYNSESEALDDFINRLRADKLLKNETYKFKDKVIWISQEAIVFNEKIAEIVEFERCLLVRSNYSNENPTNNLVAIDFSGNIIWQIDEAIKPLEPQTIVSIGKRDSQHLSLVTFTGLNLLVLAESGQIVKKAISK